MDIESNTSPIRKEFLAVSAGYLGLEGALAYAVAETGSISAFTGSLPLDAAKTFYDEVRQCHA